MQSPEIFKQVRTTLDASALSIADEDLSRPWGGFYVLNESALTKFIEIYFPELRLGPEEKDLQMSPKILMVAPRKRLSWQYHFRRAEIWRVVSGPVGIMLSEGDGEQAVRTFSAGKQLRIAQGVRHRLVGLDTWGVVAEIWQHIDTSRPSDEADIIRLQDDFGR
jgi:mannose-6-phosphate isomerase